MFCTYSFNKIQSKLRETQYAHALPPSMAPHRLFSSAKHVQIQLSKLVRAASVRLHHEIDPNNMADPLAPFKIIQYLNFVQLILVLALTLPPQCIVSQDVQKMSILLTRNFNFISQQFFRLYQMQKLRFWEWVG